MYKVSLLLTTYNTAKYLPVTLESIKSQTYKPIEVVIVDGCSTDGTVDIIKQFEKDKDSDIELRWISEPDSGLYNAMNKACSICTGDIIAVCNDCLCEKNAVALFVKAIEDAGDECIGAHSDLVYKDGDRIIRTWHMGDGKIEQGWMPGHPALFLKRKVYDRYGNYDEAFHCAADYEFMVRFLTDEKNRLAYIPKVLVAMFYGGTSNAGLRNYLVSFKEGYRALRFNQVKHPLWITLKRTWRVLRQF